MTEYVHLSEDAASVVIEGTGAFPIERLDIVAYALVKLQREIVTPARRQELANAAERGRQLAERNKTTTDAIDDDVGRREATKIIVRILADLLIEKGVNRQEIVSKLDAFSDDLMPTSQERLSVAGIQEIERVIALLGGRSNPQ